MQLSIVIPCYNHGTYLEECLAELQDIRTDYEYEVIVVNDGSTEPETLKILDSLEGSDICIINQSNKGLAAARNSGIHVARGKYILPLDCDNILLETYINDGIGMLESEEKLGVVYANAEYFGEREGIWRVPDFDYRKLYMANYIDACAIFRKKDWEHVGGYDERMPYMGWEDWDLWMRLALAGIRFKHLSRVGFKYRVRSDSMIRTTKLHEKELREYIFNKKGMDLARELRNLWWELETLKAKSSSMEYKIGKWLLFPLRILQRIRAGRK